MWCRPKRTPGEEKGLEVTTPTGLETETRREEGKEGPIQVSKGFGIGPGTVRQNSAVR